MLKPQLWFAIDGGRVQDSRHYRVQYAHTKKDTKTQFDRTALMCPQAKINDGIV